MREMDSVDVDVLMIYTGSRGVICVLCATFGDLHNGLLAGCYVPYITVSLLFTVLGNQSCDGIVIVLQG